MDKAEQQRILKERAGMMATEEAAESSEKTTEVLRFSLYPERFAIESSYVKEVITLKNLTPLPGIPAFVMGIMSYRGRILSAVNLRNFLNLTETGLSEMNKVIVLGDEEMEFGLVADKIEGTERILNSGITAPPFSLSERGRELIKGIAGGEVVLLDGNKLLHHNQMKIDQKNK